MKEALKKLEKPETTEISAEGKEDLPEIKISFIGVAPENKQPMSKAFEDVPGLPKFSGSSISEWSQDIDLR